MVATAARAATALPAAVGLLLAAVLGGCSAPARGTGGPQASPTPSPVAQEFRSARTYPAVPPPVRVRVPAARVDSRLQRVGRATDGTMELPSRPELAAWYAEGPRPGQPGPAVIIGHVSWDRAPGVFFRLSQLRSGDRVYVDRADGTTAEFRVTGSARVAKHSFPTDAVYAPNLEPSLRLVTCGGSFDYATGNYRDNVIVFAAPS